MASNDVISPYHLLQTSFATGEISKEVANRVDLDKYQFALTKAENCLIRPYGPAYKRPGSLYVAGCKNNSKCILQSFSGANDADYLMEIGAGYIRIYKDGAYKAEISTPFSESVLTNLRFTQSADTMFIASGDYPLKVLRRYSDTSWAFGDYEIAKPYFDDSLGGGSEDCTITPSGTSGNITLTANEDIFFSGLVGGHIRLKQDVASATESGSVTSSSGQTSVAGTYTSSAVTCGQGREYTFSVTSPSSDSQKWEGYVYLQKSSDGTTWSNVETTTAHTRRTIEGDGDQYRILAQLTSGTVFKAAILDGGVEKVTISKAAANDGWVSNSLYCGESWKIITHGTWKGSVKVQSSDDGSNWKEYRSYSGNEDYNVTESGSLSEGKYIRAWAKITSGTCTIDLTRLTYIEEGYVKVTGYTDAKHVSATVEDKLGNTDATKQWSFSAWCSSYGYPKTVAFFQDRLCLGGNKNQPYMLWMSKTGDYNNFSVEKADGKVTDDSAVALSFVSRKQFEIKHLVPNTDLIILTKGNEWILSGSEVITPSNSTPKMQTTRGCGNVEPIMIGSKTVFVQGRGSVVRDMGYSYETDSYGGVDLTLLDKTIVNGKKIIDAAYMQEPNSAIYYVRDDGTIAVLTYVIDQKVYAWSTLATKGNYESICSVAEGDTDTIYVVANRNAKRYIEKFQGEVDSTVPNDYVMLDCASTYSSNTGYSTFTLTRFANSKVTVLGDGREFKDISVNSAGQFTLPTVVKNAIVGYPYTMKLELPNVEIRSRDGSIQGRYKAVPEVMLRLYNTLGGNIGPTESMTDEVHYDEFQDVTSVALYSGDKKVQMPLGGFNTDGRVSIISDDPYPFNLLSVVRQVSVGG